MRVTLISGQNTAAYQNRLSAIGVTPYVEDTDHIKDLGADSTDLIYVVPMEFTEGPDWGDVRTRLSGANRYYLVCGEELTTERIITSIRDGAFDVLDVKDPDSRWEASMHEANSSQDLWWQLYGGYSGTAEDDLLGRSVRR